MTSILRRLTRATAPPPVEARSRKPSVRFHRAIAARGRIRRRFRSIPRPLMKRSEPANRVAGSNRLEKALVEEARLGRRRARRRELSRQHHQEGRVKYFRSIAAEQFDRGRPQAPGGQPSRVDEPSIARARDWRR